MTFKEFRKTAQAETASGQGVRDEPESPPTGSCQDVHPPTVDTVLGGSGTFRGSDLTVTRGPPGSGL